MPSFCRRMCCEMLRINTLCPRIAEDIPEKKLKTDAAATVSDPLLLEPLFAGMGHGSTWHNVLKPVPWRLSRVSKVENHQEHCNVNIWWHLHMAQTSQPYSLLIYHYKQNYFGCHHFDPWPFDIFDHLMTNFSSSKVVNIYIFRLAVFTAWGHWRVVQCPILYWTFPGQAHRAGARTDLSGFEASRHKCRCVAAVFLDLFGVVFRCSQKVNLKHLKTILKPTWSSFNMKSLTIFDPFDHIFLYCFLMWGSWSIPRDG